MVSSTPGSDPQSIFEVLGHVVVGHDVVQHSGDNRVNFLARVLATGKVKFVLNSRGNPIGGRLGFSHMALASWGAAHNSGGARGQVAPWRKGRSPLIIVTHTYSH